MPSPFPGMDPYLESPERWPVLQREYVSCLADSLQPALADRYRVRTMRRTYSVRQALFTSVFAEEHQEATLEISDRETDRQVVLVELPSPANRLTQEGRNAYLAARAAAEKAEVHFVEVDLVLAGRTLLAADLAALAERQYVVSVLRATRPPKYELYGSSLRKRLPRIRLPLASDDRGLIVDLQAVLNRTYDRFFQDEIDYSAPPPVPLEPGDADWVADLLKTYHQQNSR